MFAIARHLTVPASAFLLRKKGTEDVITNRHLVNRRGRNRRVHRNYHAARRSGGAPRHQSSHSGRILPFSGLSDRSLGCLFEGACDSTSQRTKRGIARIQELKPTSPRRLWCLPWRLAGHSLQSSSGPPLCELSGAALWFPYLRVRAQRPRRRRQNGKGPFQGSRRLVLLILSLTLARPHHAASAQPW